MADEKPSLIQIDDDWKAQAQAEKQKLAEAAKAKDAAKAKTATPPPAATPTEDAGDDGTPFDQLVRTVLTQTMLYLGMLRTGRATTDYDAAKRQIDMLGVLKDKTAGNLTADETSNLDIALHEARSRYVSAVSQTII
ncbi:MAG: DUF1844 domain-containing protein [Planctomycetota bacterium]